VAADAPAAFFSYSREDSEFALRLAEDLKAAGAVVWIDQLDISPSEEWDIAVEEALIRSPRVLLILSPASVKSKSVRNEIAFALDEKKAIIPVLYQDCMVPLQLRRIQHIDFRSDYARGLKQLLKALGVTQPTKSVPHGSRDRDLQAPSNVDDMIALRRRLEPRIEIGEPVHFQYTIAQVTTHAYRIPIRNVSQTETIKNVNVLLTSIQPEPPEYTWGSTMRLHWKHDNKPKEDPEMFAFSKTRDLQAGTPEEIDFVYASIGSTEIFVFTRPRISIREFPGPAISIE